MKLTSRKTHNFVELKVDKIEETIFKSDHNEIKETIENLFDVIDDLARLNNKTIQDYIPKLDY